MIVIKTDCIKNKPVTAKAKKSGGVGGFYEVLGLSNKGKEVGGLASLSETSDVQSLVALQELGEKSDKELYKQGNALLDALDKYRQGILLGRIDKKELEELSHLLKIDKRKIANPQLEEAIKEIETRVAVELAKLEA